MSPSGNGRRRLVADRRTQSQPKRPARSRSGGSGGNRGSGGNKRKRRTTKRKPRQYGGPLGFVARFIRFVFRLIWSLIWRGAVVVGLLVALATGYYYAQLPDVSDLFDARSRGSVTMLDRHGEVFAWRGEQFGGEIDPTNTSLHLVNAVVATEDRRFWRHLGVSPRGIASAIRINLREGRGPLQGHGGSTITQQVAKLLCLGVGYDPDEWETEADYEADCRRTTIWRKIQEVPFSLAMELRYSKAEILSVYLNRAYLGRRRPGLRGGIAALFRDFGGGCQPAASSHDGRASGCAVLLRPNP